MRSSEFSLLVFQYTHHSESNNTQQSIYLHQSRNSWKIGLVHSRAAQFVTVTNSHLIDSFQLDSTELSKQSRILEILEQQPNAKASSTYSLNVHITIDWHCTHPSNSLRSDRCNSFHCIVSFHLQSECSSTVHCTLGLLFYHHFSPGHYFEKHNRTCVLFQHRLFSKLFSKFFHTSR